MKQYLDAFFAMGVYAYVIIGVFVLAAVFSIISMKMNGNALKKWLASHPGAVKISLEAGTSLITQKELYASVVSGEAAIFMEVGKYVIYAVPGKIVLEITYTYTRPGVLHKQVSTTWGPTKLELDIQGGNEYALSFNQKEEAFKLMVK